MEAIKQKLPVIIMIIGVILLCLFFSITGSAQPAAEPQARAALSERYQDMPNPFSHSLALPLPAAGIQPIAVNSNHQFVRYKIKTKKVIDF